MKGKGQWEQGYRQASNLGEEESGDGMTKGRGDERAVGDLEVAVGTIEGAEGAEGAVEGIEVAVVGEEIELEVNLRPEDRYPVTFRPWAARAEAESHWGEKAGQLGMQEERKYTRITRGIVSAQNGRLVGGRLVGRMVSNYIRRLGVLLPGEEGHSTGRNCEEGRYG